MVTAASASPAGANGASTKATEGYSPSTSAGSAASPASCGGAMASNSSSPSKAASPPVPELPEYDYPTPFALATGKASENSDVKGVAPALPEGDYPCPVVIKNTFLDSPADKTESLEGFFQEREISSCPPGAIGAAPGLKLAKVQETVHEAEDEDSKTDTASHAGTGTVSHTGTNMTPSGLPDMDYPSPVFIKNTFIDSPTSDPTSLDGFLQDRGAHSAPASGLVGPPGLRRKDEAGAFQADEAAPAAGVAPSQVISTPFPSAMYEQPMGANPEALHAALQKAAASPAKEPAPAAAAPPPVQSQVVSTPLSSAIFEPADAVSYTGASEKAAPAGEPPAVPPPPSAQAPSLEPVAVPPPPPKGEADEARPLKVVRIADALTEPEVGTPENPTIGSAGHRFGTCKPCAFMHTKGCTNGKDCEFCHLCAPGERKRRQKQKLAQAAREQQAQQQQVSLWNSLQDTGTLGMMAPPR